MTYRLASHLGSHPRKVTTTSSAWPIPAAFGRARSEPARVPFPTLFIGDPPVQVCGTSHRHSTSSAAVSLGLIGLRANERRCNGFTLVSRPEMEGDG
jgi:hypothetical protein